MSFDERRTAVIYIVAAPGHGNAARALAGDAIREALGVKKWYTPPHTVTYTSAAEARREGDMYPRPFFTLDVTDAEMRRLDDVIVRLAAERDWERPPFDVYHD